MNFDGMYLAVVYRQHAKQVGFCGCWRCKLVKDYTFARPKK